MLKILIIIKQVLILSIVIILALLKKKILTNILSLKKNKLILD